jgi:transposase
MQPLLPSSTGRRGGRWRDHRQVIEAIAWKYRTGSPWRELPESFGPWQTAYERLTRWSADGTWAALLARAQADADAAGELDWLVRRRCASRTLAVVSERSAATAAPSGAVGPLRAGLGMTAVIPGKCMWARMGREE